MSAAIEPRDMPELRATLLDYAERGGARWFWGMHLDRTHNDYGMGRKRAADVWGEMEVRRLREADLFHVAPNMCELIKQAAPALPEFDIEPFDVPAEVGLCVWHDPTCLDRDGRTQAATWSPVGGVSKPSEKNPEGDGVWVTWYEQRDAAIKAYFQESDHEQILSTLAGLPFVIVGKLLMPFGRRPIVKGILNNEFVELDAKHEHVLIRARALVTTWRLMQDKVSALSTVHPDRSSRRRLERAQRPVSSVRVISLRTASGSSQGDSSRDYHHRWVVRGHWRMQAVGPGRAFRRPTWVVPHVKGPEDAPTIGGEKVYALKR